MGDYLMSLIKANNITNTTGGIPTVKSQQLIPTAWVNVQENYTIRDSEGVSSVSDITGGQLLVSFTTAMANTNYAVVATCSTEVSGNTGLVAMVHTSHTGVAPLTPATTGVRISTVRLGATDALESDSPYTMVVVMGGQA